MALCNLTRIYFQTKDSIFVSYTFKDIDWFPYHILRALFRTLLGVTTFIVGNLSVLCIIHRYEVETEVVKEIVL